MTLYDTYKPLFCKENIQMTSYYNTINVQTKKSKQNDNSALNKLYYNYCITLTCYYIVKVTFRWQVIIAPPMWKQTNNEVNKMTTVHWIKLEIIIHYVILSTILL